MSEENEAKSSIGARLKAARTAKGLTIDDLQQITKIQKRYLIAIEDEQFDKLPGDFYVRAFIKQYADTVDLDGNALLKEYSDELPTSHAEVNVQNVDEVQPTRTSSREQPSSPTNRVRNYLPTIIITAIVVLILLFIWFMAVRTHTSSSTATSTSSSSTQVSSSKASSKASSKKAASSSAAKASSKKAAAKKSSSSKQTIKATGSSDTAYRLTNGAKKNKVVLKATKAAWTSVTTNGSTTWQGTLTAGGSHTVTLPSSATTVKFQFGNAVATSATINGKKFNFNPNNSSTQVRTITLTIK
ncbi:helix-turn-helix domain-containing protein [Lactiplantibacillus daowaiensis]|uniref:Helix-turn-helix domain-containing protein n=1 Tax=Lactiplantibacillus daowaiensis TaxID=2559918 RepID=A0ABW1RZN9_9LACO|nr:helix-turn-helix domain-containing protein [Lactiplantibacillus daowaiensis]